MRTHDSENELLYKVCLSDYLSITCLYQCHVVDIDPGELVDWILPVSTTQTTRGKIELRCLKYHF